MYLVAFDVSLLTVLTGLGFLHTLYAFRLFLRHSSSLNNFFKYLLEEVKF